MPDEYGSIIQSLGFTGQARTIIRSMFGSRLAKVLGARFHYCELEGLPESPEFAVTRLRSGSRSVAKTSACPKHDAVLVWVALTPTPLDRWRARYNGREVGVTRGTAFATTVLDLNCSIEMWNRGPFDYLVYYLADSLLRKVALENEVAATYQLREAFFIEDLLVSQLTRSILYPARHAERMDKLTLSEIAALLGAHVLQRYCGTKATAGSCSLGLKTWQRLRALEMMNMRLDGSITIEEIATACSLSMRHFTRNFRRTFGVSAHQYLTRLRFERAKTLLLDTNQPLAEIAHLCGFSDQPAFTRAFSKVERMTPARWRKSNT